MQSSIKKYIATLAFGACSTVALAATAATAHEDTLVLAKGMEAASVRVELSDLNLDTAKSAVLPITVPLVACARPPTTAPVTPQRLPRL